MSAIARWLGRAAYVPTWRAMQRYTDTRDAESPDELWCLEHAPVYTLGMNADPAHVLAAGDIPVVRIDRGGQVTYHGPGQLVVYPLVDLRRAGLVYRRRPAGQDVSAWADGLNGLRRRVVGKQFAIDIGLAHAASDQLRVLRAEVQDGDRVHVSGVGEDELAVGHVGDDR